MVELKGRERERVETYSRGMRQRLHIARGLLHDPEILFLDEPTIGLDPVGARELRDTIANLHGAGKTILLTTHYMYEADALCQRIAVIANGNFVATGTPSDLKQVVGDHTIVEIETFGIADETVERLRRLPGVRAVGVETREHAQVLLVQSAVGADVVRALLNELAGADTGKVITREPTLEDAYVELVRSA
jgi:ABC-2 type transport system ATP-binding protein